jgi:hypothetical protein
MFKKFKRILIGKPMKSNEAHNQKLNNYKALAILSSDALSSIAYGPEQILIVLATVSVIAFWYSLPFVSSSHLILSSNYFCISQWRRSLYGG